VPRLKREGTAALSLISKCGGADNETAALQTKAAELSEFQGPSQRVILRAAKLNEVVDPERTDGQGHKAH
jgi:hypothetical protein